MAYISQITLPDNSTYNLKDSRVDNLGTAAEKNFTTTISSEGTDLPTAGAVYTAIQNSTITETDPTVPAWAKASTKPSYTAREISGAVRVDGSYGSPVYAYGVYGLTSTGTTQIPAYSATITNDNQVTTKKYVDDAILNITETDPTVPAWAKASTKPSYTFSEIGSTPTTLSGYGIMDAYTKTEIDSLVASVLHYKGTKATVSALPSSGNTLGDVWHVTADGSEWAWDGTEWQELGTAIDLSGYVPTEHTTEEENYKYISIINHDGYTLTNGVTLIDKSNDSPLGDVHTILSTYAASASDISLRALIGVTDNNSHQNNIILTPTTTTIQNVVTPTANGDAVNKAYVDAAISGISGLQHILDGNATGSVRTSGSKSEGSSYTIGNNAFAEGYFTEAKGISSHAEGHTTSAVGNYSHAQGGSTTASGSYAHAEGSRTTAGNYAHAQGESTIASGQYSHAQGQGTTASGIASHASGTGTTAQRKSQYTFGQYNILDTTGTISTRGDYVFIIGNGTADAARSNALTVDWNGNLATAGNVTANGNQLSGVQIIRW